MVILQCDAGVHDGLRARAETLLLLLNPTAAKAAKEIAK
jgi:hypothetical protein